ALCPPQIGAGPEISAGAPLPGRQRLANRRWWGATMMGPAFDSLSHDNRWASWPPARFLVGVLLMALGLVSPLRGATVDRYLEYPPDTVQLVLVFDTSTAVADRLAQSMPREIDAQARLAYGPLWRRSITIAKGDEAVRWGRGATAADDE